MEIEDPQLLDQFCEPLQEPLKMVKVLYSRDFLLSFKELDVCQKLPSGFKESLLSEFDATYYANVQEQQGVRQIIRRSEYSSSPLTKGDSNNYLRGIHGRWDSRASSRNDSQPDHDSESGKHGNQPTRSWKNLEQHDGLLGSGSFSRQSGFSADSSTPKVEANNQKYLNRTNEPYHPPRPYKASLSPAGLDSKNSYNDETFGSFECSSEDRAEEEKRRRASFELMRKEQKEMQQKQTLNPDQHKEKSASDFSFLLEESKAGKEHISADNVLDVSIIEISEHGGSGKSIRLSQAPASRPPVPPGFTSMSLDRYFGMRTLNHSLPKKEEIGKLQVEDNPPHAKDSSVLNGVFVNQVEKQSESKEGLSEQPFETSPTILEKLFGTALMINNSGSSDSIEHAPSPNSTKTSKFAHWFIEDEKKSVIDDYSLGMSSDSLSLIIGNEDVGSKVFHEQNLPGFHFTCPDLKNNLKEINVLSNTVEISEKQLYSSDNKSYSIPTVITCEDLEQSILSEISENNSNLHSIIVPDLNVNLKTVRPNSISIDDHASHHLLSLLQQPIENVGTTALNNSKDHKAANVSGNTSTLENLFGSAFMDELQDPVGSARIDVDRKNENNSLNFQTSVFDTELAFHLPEEESLFANNPIRSQLSNTPVSISQKLAARSKGQMDERYMSRQEVPPFMHHNLIDTEIPCQIPHFNPHGKNLRSFDAHDVLLHQHQLRVNMLHPQFQQPNNVLSDFGQASQSQHHQMLQHQMHVADNFPSPDMLRGYLRGGHMPPQHNTLPGGFMQDPNRAHGSLFGNRNPNFPNPGMRLSAHEVGGRSNEPEVLQRLFEMEQRSNMRQINPFTNGGACPSRQWL